MSKDVIARTGLTGGASGDLDAYPVADCENDKPAHVYIQGTGMYVYIYDESEAGAESSPDIIIPDDNSSGTGAWKLESLYADTLAPSNGIYLGGTDAANLLDDWEEDTYTVTCTPETSGSVTLSDDTLAYTKIGQEVTVVGRISVDSVSSPNGMLEFSLPFANGSGVQYQSAGGVLHQSVDLDTGVVSMGVFVQSGSSTFRLRQTVDNDSAIDFGTTNQFAGGEVLWVNFTYFTAA